MVRLYRWQLRKWPLHTRRVSRITVKALVTSSIIQSVGLVGKGRLKEKWGLEPRTFFFFRLRNRQNLVRIRFVNILYFVSCYSITGQRLYFLICPAEMVSILNQDDLPSYRIIS
jgi:hypothetical protein